EQEREQERLDGDVGELRRLALDVHEVPPGEHDHVAHAGPEAGEGVGVPDRRCGRDGHGHRDTAASSGATTASLGAGAPVRAKKTSSSEGGRTSMSSTSAPTASRARTTVLA